MNRFISFALLVLLTASAFAEDPILYARPRQLGRLANTDIKTSAGIAISLENENLLWSHNRGDTLPRFFGFNLQGTHVVEYRIDAKLIELQDMASYRVERQATLVFADVGDYELKRKSYVLYLLREPRMTKAPKFGKIDTIKPQMTLEFTYDTGPQHCQAVAVDASDPKAIKFIFISSNEGGNCIVYELPMPGTRDKGPLVAKTIAKLTIPTVTSLDISPDGSRMMVLTYGDGYEFTRTGDKKWSDALATKPRILEMPIRHKGEAICYGADGKTLYLTADGARTPLWMVGVREE